MAATRDKAHASADPSGLWADAAGVLARVLRGGSLKSLLAPMPSQRARPVNALITETLKKRALLAKFVAECGPWSSDRRDGLDELRLLVGYEALFGRGLRQPPLVRGAANDPALAEAIARIRAWQTTALKSAKAAEHAQADPEPGADGEHLETACEQHGISKQVNDTRVLKYCFANCI